MRPYQLLGCLSYRAHKRLIGGRGGAITIEEMGTCRVQLRRDLLQVTLLWQGGKITKRALSFIEVMTG